MYLSLSLSLDISLLLSIYLYLSLYLSLDLSRPNRGVAEASRGRHKSEGGGVDVD